jgi:hypothetical protein
MTNEDIIRLAIEHTIHGLKFDEEGLVRFAKLIAEHEREACANLCIELAPSIKTMTAYKVLHEASKAIKSRGQA